MVFATNNSAPTTGELLARLDAFGVTSSEADLISSAGAAASLLHSGQSVKVLAEAGVLEALDARGITVADGERADAAIVGWTRSFDFDSLAATATVARSSGRLVATNEDPTHPDTEGPDAGGRGPARRRGHRLRCRPPRSPASPMNRWPHCCGSTFGFANGDRSVVMVGDQPRTDGKLAERLGVPFGLVDSGVTAAGTDDFDVPVAVRYPDFTTMVRSVLD